MLKKFILILFVVLFTVTTAAEQPDERVVVKVKGLVCSFCAFSLKKTFNKFDVVSKIDVDLDQKEVYIEFKKDQTLSDQIIEQTVEDAGYNVASINRGQNE